MQETGSYLPLAIQICSNVVDQTLNSQMKQIVYDSFVSKELSSAPPTTLVDDARAEPDTGAPATVSTHPKTNSSVAAPGSPQPRSLSTPVEKEASQPGLVSDATEAPEFQVETETSQPASCTDLVETEPPQVRAFSDSDETETPQARPFSTPVESDTPQPRPPFSTPLETKAPQLRNIPTPLGTKTPQPRPFSPPGAMETLQPRPVETEILQSGTSSTSVESEASTESGNFELLRAKYESQLKRIMVSELFDAERAPVEEGLLFKSDSGAGIVSNELDSLPGSKEDPNYWQPDVDRLLDSIKVAEMFRQISPELLWLGELRDHLISEAIHKRLRNTSVSTDPHGWMLPC